ncbi:methionyl-tRNA formyltransferase [Shewanella sp. SR43-4]|uniref:methionyl-tRNA formyltransferase n=1 Tax=Shewanella sp. SR43-4 TaxID=2760942 RepID=UPI0015FD4B73|nr:methionyl-tRNA formyltransferase [Shewanella sp. SR43-4]MBB1319589.1 methionyl-tRNA formyltransferase [Shewanella sp. SR43-4]|tara:strand:+ start:3427 stop:3657 length:231 start_codon:yes stop_codon:yes gene_type:complete
MAIVRDLIKLEMEKQSAHSEVKATYSVLTTEDGTCLQIDTYGSITRELLGKKSQSIRLTKEALSQLVQIINENKLI